MASLQVTTLPSYSYKHLSFVISSIVWESLFRWGFFGQLCLGREFSSLFSRESRRAKLAHFYTIWKTCDPFLTSSVFFSEYPILSPEWWHSPLRLPRSATNVDVSILRSIIMRVTGVFSGKRRVFNTAMWASQSLLSFTGFPLYFSQDCQVLLPWRSLTHAPYILVLQLFLQRYFFYFFSDKVDFYRTTALVYSHLG